MQVFVIGCGGGASYLAPVLYRHLGSQSSPENPQELYLIDRDKVESRNRRRQNFLEHQDGESKAEALRASLLASITFPEVSIHCRREYIREDSRLPVRGEAILFAMVDNHPARKSALALADRYGVPCICAANEQHSAEAYYYHPNYYGTPCDPRVVYPEILTDTRDDPTRPSCNEVSPGETAEQQGVIANLLSASAALHLFQAHQLGTALSQEYRCYLPFMVRMYSYGMECLSFKSQLGDKYAVAEC